MLLSSHGACDLNRHESAMAAEKEGGLKEAQLMQQRHEKAISELQVLLSHSVLELSIATLGACL